MAALIAVVGLSASSKARINQPLDTLGTNLVLADLQDVAAKEHADRLTRQGPGSAVGVYVDVRDADAVARLVESTHAEHGQLDLMVNNAGIWEWAHGRSPVCSPVLCGCWVRSTFSQLRSSGGSALRGGLVVGGVSVWPGTLLPLF